MRGIYAAGVLDVFLERASRMESVLASLALRDQPGLARAFRVYRDRYARSVTFLRRPPRDCTILEVVPSRHLRTGRTTRDPRALAEDYAAGRAAGLRAIQRWPTT